MKKFLMTILILVSLYAGAFASGKPYVANVTLTSATTEYTWTIPYKTTSFTIQSRTASDFKIAAVSGSSGTTYFTVKSGMSYYETEVDNWGGKIYMQSDSAGQVIEIVYWINN